MRKALVVILGAMLLLPLAAPQALAWSRWHPSRSYNAFWYLRRNVDSDTYVKVTWYAGVYEEEGSFWSDLYRYAERCERRPGRDQCHDRPYMVGVIEDLGDGEFTLSEGLDTGFFEATYPMEVYSGRHEHDAGEIQISVNLTGVGDLSSSFESYFYEEGCIRYGYRSRSESRQATANGLLTFLETGATKDLPDTDDANMRLSRYRTQENDIC